LYCCWKTRKARRLPDD